jgi:hypothetical protein
MKYHSSLLFRILCFPSGGYEALLPLSHSHRPSSGLSQSVIPAVEKKKYNSFITHEITTFYLF